MLQIAVLGGGISGLAAAWRLQTRGVGVTLFEASDRTGGVIRSVRRDGFLVDEGPNTLVARHADLEGTLRALGLDTQRVWADEHAAKRYVVRGGTPTALPASPRAFLSTPLFSGRAKLRLLREPFIRRSALDDEPVSDFVRRRLGQDVLDYAVDPFVAGILAGDPTRLSTRYAFPPLWTLEQDYGSLFLGMMRNARATRGEKRPSRLPFSFHDGLQTLPDTLAQQLSDAIHTDTSVVALAKGEEHWTVSTRSGENVRERDFDGVISTLPLHRFVGLGFASETDLEPLRTVHHTDLTVLALGFDRDQVAHPLDGFGMLVPSTEPFGVLGVLFSSTLFPGRAPDGKVLLTCFVGGRRDPERARMPTADLVPLVCRDLGVLLGVRSEPTFVHRTQWERVIPQAEIGYGRVIDTLDALEARHPGLRFAGSYRYGVSVGDALRSGLDAANALVP